MMRVRLMSTTWSGCSCRKSAPEIEGSSASHHPVFPLSGPVLVSFWPRLICVSETSLMLSPCVSVQFIRLSGNSSKPSLRYKPRGVERLRINRRRSWESIFLGECSRVCVETLHTVPGSTASWSWGAFWVPSMFHVMCVCDSMLDPVCCKMIH